jgi:DNA-binding NarL/FixJ family response regulator
MVRIALFTDEPVLVRGLSELLSKQDGFEIVAVWEDAAALPRFVAGNKPNLLLLDGGSYMTLGLLASLRAAAPDCRIVIWARAIPVEMVYQSIELGVRGILHKTLPSELIPEYLRRIAAGQLCFDETLAAESPALERVELTNRESQLLTLLARGMKNKEIASALSITEGTVKVYLSRLFQKTGVKDRYELALCGVRNLNAIGSWEEALSGETDPSVVVGRGGEPARQLPRALALHRNPG